MFESLLEIDFSDLDPFSLSSLFLKRSKMMVKT